MAPFPSYISIFFYLISEYLFKYMYDAVSKMLLKTSTFLSFIIFFYYFIPFAQIKDFNYCENIKL